MFRAGGQSLTRGMKATVYWRLSRTREPKRSYPPKANRRDPWEYDRELYRQRNLIERAFNKLKHWRRIATRYDRRSLYFLSTLYLISSVIWGPNSPQFPSPRSLRDFCNCLPGPQGSASLP